MLAEERKNKILEELKKKGSITIEWLQNKYHVARKIILRDLKQLEEKGFLIRVKGGAQLPKNYETGIFLGKIPYAKAGSGDKSIVIFPPTHHLLWSVTVDAKSQVDGYKHFIPDGFTYYILGYDPHLPKDHTSEGIASDFAKIMKEHIGPATIMAVSYGGSVAIPFAALYPELTEKLILLVSTYGSSGEGVDFAKELIQLAEEGKSFTLQKEINGLYSNRILRNLFDLKTWKNWPILERSMNPTSTFINAYKHLIDTEESRKKYLSRIQAPTLVIGGSEDQFASEEFYRKTAELIPDAHLELFEGKTHTLPVERLFEIQKIIRKFLEVEKDGRDIWNKILTKVEKIIF
ncbi:MAG: DeoR family transcriptional regulator [Promethearchaeota archaeon]